MGVDTHGKIKGFIKHEEILNFIRQKWDTNATHNVQKKLNGPISGVTWEYKMNEHSEDNENWYYVSGFIRFDYLEEERMLFYMYDNVNHLENMDYYEPKGLSDMVKAETTYLSLGCWGSSVDIIKELVAHFGGGWVDDNDCDEVPYYTVESKQDENINPVKYVSMEEIRKVFGDNVIITN
jgi:hypothetical protein